MGEHFMNFNCMPLYHKNLAYTRVETIAFDYSFSGLYLNVGLLEILKS